MLEFPLAPEFDVIVFVAGGKPELAIAFTEGEWTEEIPRPMPLVAGYLDTGIEDVMLREADAIGETLEQLSNLIVTLRATDPFSFPNAVVGEDTHDPILIVIVVADVAVFGLQLFDRFDILEGNYAFFEFGTTHTGGPFL
jgi:hypothetical protein